MTIQVTIRNDDTREDHVIFIEQKNGNAPSVVTVVQPQQSCTRAVWVGSTLTISETNPHDNPYTF